MCTKIKTNRLNYIINRMKFDKTYDVFCLVTSEKYIKSGAYILDAEELCRDIKAIRFESGKRLLVLMYKSEENKRKLKQVLEAIEEGKQYSIEAVSSGDLQDQVLLQLLFNALGSYDSEYLKFNNITGHLYAFHPSWLKRGKEKGADIIWQVPCLEIVVSPDCCLKLDIRTFTSELLKKKMTFSEKTFVEYPQYVFSAKNTLRRKLSDERERAFILRQVDGTKTEIPYLNIHSEKEFDASKMGMMLAIVTEFNRRYEGICRIEFADEIATYSIDYSKACTKEKDERVRQVLCECGVHIVDEIGDKYSEKFCGNVKDLLQSKYQVDSTIGKRYLKAKLNISVIHNAEYYAGVNDPHNENHDGKAIQHITFEDYSDSSEFALATVIHEVIIKKDLQDGRLSLFDWQGLGWKESISFGLEYEIDGVNRYYFMKIHPGGTFEICEQENSLFEIKEFSDVVDSFENAKMEGKRVLGAIRTEDGSIGIIRDTGMFTIPNLSGIKKLLSEGDNKLRGRERREELLSSCLDIKMYNEGEAQYYYVGTIGEGMRPTVQRSANIRCLEMCCGSAIELEKILPLMCVSFVHNGQLTIVPFPFKYLREYLCQRER